MPACRKYMGGQNAGGRPALFLALDRGARVGYNRTYNRSCNLCRERRQNGERRSRAADSELLVVHALGVHPQFSRRGIAGRMARHVIAMAAQNGIKTVRLDVLEGNLPPEKAYTKVGFRYVETARMFYEDTGWTNYKLYEYIVL